MQNDTTHHAECYCDAERSSSDPEAKKQASSPWQEENQEGLEALNSFHAEYGHFSGD
ncbi:type II toxin-antitoxin system CcdA family antitoxin [Klebsiella pneumoniae subsp. pneumoniae]|nr:type II toxin-antitoxin system CcdA family antitoxin [Klebsiella pneumoniae subsp. pneumoniae]